jgi:hypothetical protein
LPPSRQSREAAQVDLNSEGHRNRFQGWEFKMTKTEKQKYNRENYLKNRENILSKAKSKPKTGDRPVLNIIPIFRNRIVPPICRSASPRKRMRFSWGTVFICILSAAMTYFLISESALYYSSFDGDKANGYFKALILEGAVVTFSILKPRTRLLRVSYQLMIAFTYIYSVWVISGVTIGTAFQQDKNLKINQKITLELETEIFKKETLRDRYVENERITLARVVDRELDSLKLKLDRARNPLMQTSSSEVIKTSAITLTIFRVLVMMANLLCLQELSRRFRFFGRSVD